MSRLFGDLRQIGYVVHDIEAAMLHWVESLGIGPFFYFERVPLKDFRYRGEAHEIELSIALANSGSIQIELIQQRNDAPSLYRDLLERNGEVVHHTSSWTTDYAADLARITAAGHRPVQDGRIGSNRLAYFEFPDTGLGGGTTMEIYDISGRAGELNERVRKAAIDWDGTKPVRRF